MRTPWSWKWDWEKARVVRAQADRQAQSNFNSSALGPYSDHTGSSHSPAIANMEARVIRAGFRQALRSHRAHTIRHIQPQPRRFLATPAGTEGQPEITPAAPFVFGDDFIDHPSKLIPELTGENQDTRNYGKILPDIRIVPASASYFSGAPAFTDNLLQLDSLLRKYQTLPLAKPGEAPTMAWKTLLQYRATNLEPVSASRYNRGIVHILQRLNQIHPAFMPEEVQIAMAQYLRVLHQAPIKANPRTVDARGWAKATGRRKTSSAVVHLVEGDGQVLINGQSLTQTFGRIHDRESAIWALKATDRIDKYNVWARVSGGGTTGQAEALTLGVAKALLVHEPALKPALRRAGCVTRDPRKVERKKPGLLKARKRPTWVAR